MRKLYLIFGMFMVFAIALAACGGDANTEGTDTGLETTDDLGMNETDDGLGTVDETPAIETEVVVETPVVETPVVETTPTTAATTVTQETPAATTEGTQEAVVPETGRIDRGRLSNLLDFEVYNLDDEKIGDIDDFILSVDEQKIDYAIIEVGGFLGIGAKQVAVPYELLELPGLDTLDDDSTTGSTQVTPQATQAVQTTPTVSGTPTTNTTTVDSDLIDRENVFILDATEEELDNAPEFDRDLFPQLGETVVEDWDADYQSYWIDGISVDTTTSQGTTTPQANMTTTPQANLTTTPTTTAGTPTADEGVTSGEFQGVVLATDLIGMTIRDEEGNDIAEVEDVIVNPETGDIRYLVLNVIGIEELDGRLLFVPLSMGLWNYDADGDVLVITLDQQVLVDAPTFEDGDILNTLEEGWDTELESYWIEFVTVGS